MFWQLVVSVRCNKTYNLVLQAFFFKKGKLEPQLLIDLYYHLGISAVSLLHDCIISVAAGSGDMLGPSCVESGKNIYRSCQKL